MKKFEREGPKIIITLRELTIRIVKAVCKKHGVFYHESAGLLEALGKYYEHMKTLGIHGSIEASLEELHDHAH